jgi:hypothetical protein
MLWHSLSKSSLRGCFDNCVGTNVQKISNISKTFFLANALFVSLLFFSVSFLTSFRYAFLSEFVCSTAYGELAQHAAGSAQPGEPAIASPRARGGVRLLPLETAQSIRSTGEQTGPHGF